MTPQERREALLAATITEAHALVESWLAEKDAEIERLRSAWTFDASVADELRRTRRDLRETEAQVRDPESVEQELDDRLADERKRTADEIAQQLEQTADAWQLDAEPSRTYRVAYSNAARIAREVGGSA